MTDRPFVAIVDFGMGNLFSIRQACRASGLEGRITSSWKDVVTADAVILPGVGAFGTAMERLHALDMVAVLRDVAESEKPLVGICLGMQLFMSESYEFGYHLGLGVFDGPVVRFENPREGEKTLKVPHVGWSRVLSRGTEEAPGGSCGGCPAWNGSLLKSVREAEFMYFVHSYFVKPADPDLVLAVTRYGHIKFCSAMRRRNVFACQFHPERSGTAGLQVYYNLAAVLDQASA
jgi:glutamine amidotransferase